MYDQQLDESQEMKQKTKTHEGMIYDENGLNFFNYLSIFLAEDL